MNRIIALNTVVVLLAVGCRESDPESRETENPKTPEVVKPVAADEFETVGEPETSKREAGETEPDIDDREAIEKILAVAVLWDTLGEVGPEKGSKEWVEQGSVYYAPAPAPPFHTPFTGWAKRVYDNGNVKSLAQFNNGRNYGPSFQWYDTGQKEGLMPYKDGKPEGLSTVWHENGQKSHEMTFKDGKREGLYTLWYENGQKRNEATFKNGSKDGLESTWHKDGQKMGELHYKDRQLDGLQTSWDADGNVTSEVRYENGEIVKTPAP